MAPRLWFHGGVDAEGGLAERAKSVGELDWITVKDPGSGAMAKGPLHMR